MNESQNGQGNCSGNLNSRLLSTSGLYITVALCTLYEPSLELHFVGVPTIISLHFSNTKLYSPPMTSRWSSFIDTSSSSCKQQRQTITRMTLSWSYIFYMSTHLNCIYYLGNNTLWTMRFCSLFEKQKQCYWRTHDWQVIRTWSISASKQMQLRSRLIR